MTAIEARNPPPGCIHHSDRGSQYAAQAYRAQLCDHGLVGSMARRGNPYDNATIESFMKTLKVEGVYPMAFESAADVAEHLPRFIDSHNEAPTLGARLSEPQPFRGGTGPQAGQSCRLNLSGHRGHSTDLSPCGDRSGWVGSLGRQPAVVAPGRNLS